MAHPTEPTDEISRLADAIDAFLEHRRAPDESESRFLERHAEVQDYLAPMLADAETGPPATGPKILGPYRIVREIGRGGMGVVYEAEQDNLRRRVALKVLPALATLSARRIERFLREAKSAARLDHPGIARVFDAGEQDGTWYYAMELVDGRSLRDAFATIRSACERDPRRLGREPQLGIPTAATWHAEVSQLGVQVAEALAHAHLHGVLHRDVKPQNIVLDHDGRPRLVDFGLAKDLTEVSLSATDEFAGTPHYVSPEQAEPDGRPVDARTDVFSLGIVLYELLAMRRPFDGPSTEHVLRAITGDEPRPLRLFDPSISRDLENVVGKALRKDRNERYASAQALADDLGRHLRGEPVHARPVPWPKRLWRHARRHRARAIAAVLAVLLFVVTPTAVAILLESARAETARQRDRADANLAQAWQAVDRLLTRVADEDLPDVPRLQGLRRELLQDARAFHERLLAMSRNDPALAHQAARAHGRMGRILVELDSDAEALPAFDAAIAKLRALLASEAASDTHRYDLAVVLADRAMAKFAVGDPAGGSRDVTAAIAEWTAIPDGSPLHGAAELDIASTELRTADAVRLRSPAEATARRDRALAIFARREADLVGDPARLCTRAEALLLLANEQMERGDHDGSTASLDAADADLDRASHAAGDAPRPRQLAARALQVRSRLAEAKRDVPASEAGRREALAMRRALAVEFPTGSAYRFGAAVAAEDLGRLLMRLGRDAEAEELLETAIADLEHVRAADPQHAQVTHFLGTTLTTHASLLSRNGGDEQRVEGEFRLAAATLETAIERDPAALHHRSALGAALSNHALWIARRDPPRAQRLAERAIEAQQLAIDGDPDHPTYRAYMANHRAVAIDACLRQGDHTGAAEHTEGLLTIPRRGARELAAAATSFATCAWSIRTHPEWADGYVDRAVEALTTIALEFPDKLASTLEDPRLAWLRGDPRVRALAEESRR